MQKINRLEIYTGTSRARNTEGWTIVGLKDENGRRWTTCGGNYDMRGTVLGDYFADEHQEALLAFVAKHRDKFVDCGYAVPGYLKLPGYAGITIDPDGAVLLDGGCGTEAMERIIRDCGYSLEYSVNRLGNVTAYYLQKEAA